jgi:hypothetical protein
LLFELIFFWLRIVRFVASVWGVVFRIVVRIVVGVVLCIFVGVFDVDYGGGGRLNWPGGLECGDV